MPPVGKSVNEYLFKLRQTVDQLNARVRVTTLHYSNREQDKTVLHFMNRAIQIGEACFRVADLRTPVIVLTRVLCEDLFLLFWISQSEENATEYVKAATSEFTRMARVYLMRD